LILTIIRFYPSPDTAILTPTGPENSAFAREVVNWLTRGPLNVGKLGKKVGPFPIRWEVDQKRETANLLDSLKLGDDDNIDVDLSELNLSAKVRGVSALRESLNRKARLTGESRMKVGGLKAEAARILQRIRSQSNHSFRCIKAMTIHQAKNREFENVVILWPLELTGTAESSRRLLYNGVTRAKSRVLIIVHSPPDKKGQVKDRLASPPFSK